MKINRLNELLSENKNISEEDINNFADIICARVNDKLNSEYIIEEVYLTDDVFEITVSDDNNLISATEIIDTNNISNSRDLLKFADDICDKLIKNVKEFDDDIQIAQLDESLFETVDSLDDLSLSDWYAERYPDDRLGIEQLKDYTIKHAKNDDLGYCDTQVRERVLKYFKKDLFEDIKINTLDAPEGGPKYGLSELINDALKSELDAVSEYNSLAVTAREEGFEAIAKIAEEIATEENKHIGQLQEALKTISPNAEAIEVGEQEGKEQLNDDIPAAPIIDSDPENTRSKPGMLPTDNPDDEF